MHNIYLPWWNSQAKKFCYNLRTLLENGTDFVFWWIFTCFDRFDGCSKCVVGILLHLNLETTTYQFDDWSDNGGVYLLVWVLHVLMNLLSR